MTRKDAKHFLCELVSKIGDTVFQHKLEQDCICGESQNSGIGVEVHPKILAYIANAINEKIERDLK